MLNYYLHKSNCAFQCHVSKFECGDLPITWITQRSNNFSFYSFQTFSISKYLVLVIYFHFFFNNEETLTNLCLFDCLMTSASLQPISQQILLNSSINNCSYIIHPTQHMAKLGHRLIIPKDVEKRSYVKHLYMIF